MKHWSSIDKQIKQSQNQIEIMEKAKITTNKGEMIVEFYENDAPNTVANFKKLANEGYYTGLK